MIEGWRDVGSAPRDEWVLLASSNGATVDIGKLITQDDGYDYWDLNRPKVYRFTTFTHWMPLPEPPEP